MTGDEITIRFIRNDLEGDQPGWTKDELVGHYKEITVNLLYGRHLQLPQDIAACQTIVLIQAIDLNGRKARSKGDKRHTAENGDAYYNGRVLTVTVNGSYADAIDFYHQALQAFKRANQIGDSFADEYTGGLPPA